jgi:hypothetical protein
VGRINRASVILGWTGGRRAHRRSRFGEEILDDDFLHMPVLNVALGDGGERVDAVDLGLADPDEDAGGERNREPASSVEGGEPAPGRLVRSSSMGNQIGPQGLDHHPLRRRNRPK